MALILNIETATTVCSVSLAQEGRLVNLKETTEGRNHAESITLFIRDVMKESGLSLKDLDAISISKGPGSYTGLRIGVSSAKGLCYSLEKPLIAINTLQSMAFHIANVGVSEMKSMREEEVLICPMIDARRMEVYSAFFNLSNKVIRETSADIIDELSYNDILGKYKVFFCGDGSAKCKPVFEKHPNAFFIDHVNPSSSYMISLSEQAFNNKQFENVAYFEPFYLKDFMTTTPKNKA